MTNDLMTNDLMTKEGFSIRRMTEEDLEEVLSSETASSLTPWSRKMFIEEMGHPYAHCFVMTSSEVRDGHVIGFICFRNMGEESELLNLCVRPEDRRRGFGRELMRFYTDFSSQRGIKTFHLEVHLSNQSALKLYHSFSYQRAGLRPKFYRGEFDALRMMKHV